MRIILPGNYLSLTGGTLTGNLNLGTNSLVFIDVILKRVGAEQLGIRDLLDTAYKDFSCGWFNFFTGITAQADAAAIQARNADNNFLSFRARDNGVGNVEVARIRGGADPSFQSTLAMYLLPIPTASLPAAPLEGMLTYDDTLKRLTYRDNVAWRTVQREYAYTELMEAEHISATAAGWEDWDISGLVPANTILVEIAISTTANQAGVGVRTNGSALERYVPLVTQSSLTMLVAPDAARIIEIYATLNAFAAFGVIGYWA